MNVREWFIEKFGMTPEQVNARHEAQPVARAWSEFKAAARAAERDVTEAIKAPAGAEGDTKCR